VKPGERWGEPATGPADVEITGSDADLARVVDTRPGALVRFRPDPSSDLARAIGAGEESQGTEMALPIDALASEPGGSAVNAVVLGTPPGRLRVTTRGARARVRVDDREIAAGRTTTVVIASGQFLDGLDVVPRGHPGDGRLEVQVYALHRSERRAMRARLPQGVHLPHPRITTAVGRRVAVELERGTLPLTVDGVAHGPVARLTVDLLPGAIRVLV
jgi:hypothetical protein